MASFWLILWWSLSSWLAAVLKCWKFLDSADFVYDFSVILSGALHDLDEFLADFGFWSSWLAAVLKLLKFLGSGDYGFNFSVFLVMFLMIKVQFQLNFGSLMCVALFLVHSGKLLGDSDGFG